MQSYDEFLQSEMYSTATEEWKPRLLDDYAVDFWSEVTADPEYQSNPADPEWDEVRAQFDSMFPRGPEIREKVEKPGYDIIGGIKDAGRAVKDVGKRVLGSVGDLMEDADPAERVTVADKLRAQRDELDKRRDAELSEADKKKRLFPVPKFISKDGYVTRGDVLDAAKSSGFSLTAMGAGTLGMILGSPGGMAGAGTGALLTAGAATGKMGYTSITTRLIDTANAELMKERGSEMTPEERKELLDRTEWARTKHAAWEAGPQAVGTVVSLSGIGKIFKGVATKGISKVLNGIAMNFGGEMLEEIPTQVGQSKAEHELGLRKEPPLEWSGEGLLTASQEVGPQVLLMGGATTGAAAAAGAVARTVTDEKTPEVRPPLKPLGSVTPKILETESVDEAIGAFTEAVRDPAPAETVEERQAAFDSATLTDAEIRGRGGAEYISASDGDRLARQAGLEEAFPVSETPEERQAAIESSPLTDEEIRGRAGAEYVPAVDGDRLKKQAEIEEAFAPPPREEQRRSTKAETYETLANKEETPLDRKMAKVEEDLDARRAVGTAAPEIATETLERQEAFEAKPVDFTASNGKPFSNEKSLKWSAAQRKVSLEGMTIVPYKGGVIAVSKAAEKAPVRHDAAVKLENGHWEINGDKSTAKGQTVDLDATQPQKEAGNYKKAHVRINGLEISIENPIGSTRTGIAPDGSEWQTPMKADYGYIKGTVGKDKDHLDVFIKPKYRGGDGPVFVVNQVDPETGKFDEHKVVMGAKTEDEAIEIYESNYEKGWPGGKSVVPMTQEQFQSWSRSEAPKKGEVKLADLPKAPKAQKALPTVDLANIPEDTMVQVKEITKDGKEQPVTRNAREALREHGELIEKYSTLLGCIQS